MMNQSYTLSQVVQADDEPGELPQSRPVAMLVELISNPHEYSGPAQCRSQSHEPPSQAYPRHPPSSDNPHSLPCF